jgi:hypothetical protein
MGTSQRQDDDRDLRDRLIRLEVTVYFLGAAVLFLGTSLVAVLTTR